MENIFYLVNEYLNFLDTPFDINYNTKASVRKSRLFSIDILNFLLNFPWEKSIINKNLFRTRSFFLSLNWLNAFLVVLLPLQPKRHSKHQIRDFLIWTLDKLFCLFIKEQTNVLELLVETQKLNYLPFLSWKQVEIQSKYKLFYYKWPRIQK